MASYAEQQIYLIGANNLHNELLALFIEEKTGARCSLETALCRVPLATNTNGRKRLVLYDFKSGRDSLEALIESDAKSIRTSDYLVLINLEQTTNIENVALQCGVRGFLHERDGTDTLLKMISAVLNDELWVSRGVMTELVLNNGLKIPSDNKALAGLTTREIDILTCIAMGHSNGMIADKYCISPHTVKTHVYNIFKKIKVSSRLQASHWYSQHL